MKRIFFLILPLIVVIALFSYAKGSQLSIIGLLRQLQTIEFQLPDTTKIEYLTGQIKSFASQSSNADNLFEWLKSIVLSIGNIFRLIYSWSVFIFEIVQETVTNILQAFKLLFNWLF